MRFFRSFSQRDIKTEIKLNLLMWYFRQVVNTHPLEIFWKIIFFRVFPIEQTIRVSEENAALSENKKNNKQEYFQGRSIYNSNNNN